MNEDFDRNAAAADVLRWRTFIRDAQDKLDVVYTEMTVLFKDLLGEHSGEELHGKG